MQTTKQKTKEKFIYEVIEFTPSTTTFEDAKTGVKSTGATLEFPSGVKGFIVVTHLNKMAWRPHEDIESITIKYKV